MDLKEYLQSHAVHLASKEERDAFFKICIENGLRVFDLESNWKEWPLYSIDHDGLYRSVHGYGTGHLHMQECQKLSFQEFLAEWGEDATEPEEQELFMMEVLL